LVKPASCSAESRSFGAAECTARGYPPWRCAAALLGAVSYCLLAPLLRERAWLGAESVLITGAFLVAYLKYVGTLGAGIGSQIYIGQLLAFGLDAHPHDVRSIFAAGGVALNHAFVLTESAWAITACVYVITATPAGTIERARQRIVGTLIGVPPGFALGVALAVLVGWSSGLLFPSAARSDKALVAE
jgi:hypothetical protein